MPSSLTSPCRLESLDIDSEMEIYTKEFYWGSTGKNDSHKGGKGQTNRREKLTFHMIALALSCSPRKL